MDTILLLDVSEPAAILHCENCPSLEDSRRDFLQAAGLLIAGLSLPGVARARDSKSDRLRTQSDCGHRRRRFAGLKASRRTGLQYIPHLSSGP